MPRTSLLGGALVLGAGLLTACGGSGDSPAGDGTVAVVASTNVYGDIARQIGGDRVRVTSIISDPSQDPHSYEASTRTQLDLSRARVVIENGGGYDDFVDRMLKTARNSSATVLNAVRISGRTAPAGGELNEHVWYDVPSMARLADGLAGALGTADPAHAATFTANAAAFKGALAPLERETAALKAAHAGAGVAITEPVPLYLLDAAGLKNETPDEFSEAVEEGDDVPARVLRQTLALFTGKKVKALVYNAQTAGPETGKLEAAAKTAGIPSVPVTETMPAGKTYQTWMAGTIAALRAALS
ncbi:metal ABC transporter solute-binding protein, Zn/Mn family [Actinomadura rayongensis]|uniref:Zinc ABC transporter solute-binding protein n=1 Tax=Actinomadura rayongensis TaxID=1429076 RepID=A0A6I4WHB7_9ACTN|nr:zinc ABC transporter substrate-binding protein [Actinomadura rayongensis]MXQ68260.1 zinc ABC transporter solute-binding protein [Actinomadura rayongensis]